MTARSDVATQLKSKVITRRGEFAALIADFPIARAITYVASPDVLLDILDAQGFEKLELVLGDSLAAVEPESLRAMDTDQNGSGSDECAERRRPIGREAQHGASEALGE